MPKYSGIFLIEDKALEQPSSAEPFLKTLNWYLGPDEFKFRHRRAANGNELLKHVKEWAGADWAYSILYFWGHGSPSALWIGDGGSDRVSLRQISQEITGVCEGSALVHFGACSTLRLTDDDFLHESGAAAFSGYRVDVDWIDSLAFEMLYMSRIQGVMSGMEQEQPSEDVYLTPEVMKKVWKDLNEGPTRSLVDHLQFSLRIASSHGD